LTKSERCAKTRRHKSQKVALPATIRRRYVEYFHTGSGWLIGISGMSLWTQTSSSLYYLWKNEHLKHMRKTSCIQKKQLLCAEVVQ